MLCFRWRLNDGYVTPNNSIKIRADGTLLIESMSEQLVGEYQCVVEVDGESYYGPVVQLSLAGQLSGVSHGTLTFRQLKTQCMSFILLTL